MNTTDFETELQTHGSFLYRCTGRSMLPLLREYRDLVEIFPCPEAGPRRGDVVLFRRNGSYVLHRVVRVTADGYVMRGDHNARPEKGVKREDLVGVMTACVRNGVRTPVTAVRCRLYVFLNRLTYPARLAAFAAGRLRKAGSRTICESDNR